MNALYQEKRFSLQDRVPYFKRLKYYQLFLLVLGVFLFFYNVEELYRIFIKYAQSESGSTIGKCYWYKSANVLGKNTDLCLHGNYDLVSNSVRLYGRWKDCDSIVEEIYNRNLKTYLDIGANIGTCVGAVAVLPQIESTVAVEVNPVNVFPLKETSKKLLSTSSSSKKTIEIFEFGLGSENGELRFHTNPQNYGGSHIDNEKGEEVVKIKRYDDAFPNGKIFDFVKMDVEGFECHVVCGALESIYSGKWRMLKTEMLPRGLSDMGCSVKQYSQLLKDIGFVEKYRSISIPILSPYSDYFLEWQKPIADIEQVRQNLCQFKK